MAAPLSMHLTAQMRAASRCPGEPQARWLCHCGRNGPTFAIWLMGASVRERVYGGER